MAARVNTKFVTVLVISLVVVSMAVAGAAWFAMSKRADVQMRRGDQAYADGDYARAKSFYGRALRSDQSNVERIDKFLMALRQVTPDSRVQYEQFYGELVAAMRNKALATVSTDIEPAIEYLHSVDMLNRRLRAGGLGRVRDSIDQANLLEQQYGSDRPEAAVFARYRGLARYEELSRLGQYSPEDLVPAREDLQRAVAYDPDDTEAITALIQLDLLEAEGHRINGRPQQEQQMLSAVDDRIAAFTQEHPSSWRAWLLQLLRKRAEVQRDLIRLEASGQLDQAQAELGDIAMKLAESLRDAGPESIVGDEASRVISVVRQFGSEEAQRIALDQVDRLAEEAGRPASYLLVLGEANRELGNLDQAERILEEVASMETPPISLEGQLLPRRQFVALDELAQIAVGRLERADEAEKSELAANVTEVIGRLEANASLDVREQAQVSIRKAQFAILQGRYNDAVVELSPLHAGEFAENPVIRRLLATALSRRGTHGEALRIYRSMIEGGQDSVSVRIGMARSMIAINEYRQAEQVLDQGREIFGGNEQFDQAAAELLERLRAQSGDIDSVTDPVFRVLGEAQQLQQQGNVQGARQRLEEGYEEMPDESRLLLALIRMDAAMGERSKALERLDEAIARYPDNDRLKSLREVVANEDPIAAQLQLIGEADVSEAVKAVQRSVILRQAGRIEESDAALARAAELDPTAPEVIEAQFRIALAAVADQSLSASERQAAQAEARRLAAIGARENHDGVNGRLMRARIEMVLGNGAATLPELQEAVEILPESMAAWRLLGVASLNAGRIEPAVAALARAYEGDPTNEETAVAYTRALFQAGQGREALEVINPQDGFISRHGGNAETVDLWLNLESRFGDINEAIETRREIFDGAVAADNQSPRFIQNAASLLDLLEAEGRTEESDEVLSTLEGLGWVDPSVLTQLRASVRVARGEYDAAEEVVLAHVETLPEGEERTPFLQLIAQIRAQSGDREGAIAVLEEAVPLQNERTRPIDRALGDLLTSAGREEFTLAEQLEQQGQSEAAAERSEAARDFYTRASDVYQRVVSSGGEFGGQQTVRKRLAETLIRAERYAEAERVLRDLSVSASDDIQVLLLQGELARVRGDRRAAELRLNEAIAQDPQNPGLFVRRALLLQSDESRTPDMLADLERAVRLDPNSSRNWRLYAQALRQEGRGEEALEQLTQGVRSNPEDRRLRSVLINVLRGTPGQAEAAVFQATNAARLYEDDPAWLKLAGDVYYEQGNYQQAAAWYERAYEAEGRDDLAASYFDAALRAGESFPRRELRLLMDRVAAIEDPTFAAFLLRARGHARLGEVDQGRELIRQGYEMAKGTPADEALWFEQMALMMNSQPEPMVAAIEAQEPYESLSPLMKSLDTRVRYQAGMISPQEAMDRLDTIETADLGPRERVALLRLRHTLLYALGRYEAAVVPAQEALLMVPNDLELNNNVAYTLSKHLDDAEEAEEYARRAAMLAPGNSAVLDTLGFTLLGLGQDREAASVLERAVAVATSDRERVIASIHLGLARYALGDRGAAQRLLRQAEASMGSLNEQALQEIGGELDELREAVGG